MQLVTALATDGQYLTKDGKGSIEDALLFYATSNELQKIAFDAYRQRGFVLLNVTPAKNNNGFLTLMEAEGKPLAFFMAHDEIIIFDENEPEFEYEHAIWLEKRHYDRFVQEYGLALKVNHSKYSLRTCGFLTERDKELWEKNMQ